MGKLADVLQLQSLLQNHQELLNKAGADNEKLSKGNGKLANDAME